MGNKIKKKYVQFLVLFGLLLFYRCSSEKKCPEVAPHRIEGKCRAYQCKRSSHCKNQQACIKEKCVPCQKGPDCEEHTACVAERCQPCKQTSDCGQGLVCLTGKCIRCYSGTSKCERIYLFGEKDIYFRGIRIVQENDGDMYMTGISEGTFLLQGKSYEHYGFFTAKLDKNGKMLWFSREGGDQIQVVQKYIYVSRRDYLAQIDLKGRVIWGKPYKDNSEKSLPFAVDKKGCVYTLTSFFTLAKVIEPFKDEFDVTESSFTLQKLSPQGKELWKKKWSTTHRVKNRIFDADVKFVGGLSIALDSSENLYIAGAFVATLELDSHKLVSHKSSTPYDSFVAPKTFLMKWDAKKGVVWAHVLNEHGADTFLRINQYDHIFVQAGGDNAHRRLFKVDQTGKSLWRYQYRSGGSTYNLFDVFARRRNSGTSGTGERWDTFVLDAKGNPNIFHVRKDDTKYMVEGLNEKGESIWQQNLHQPRGFTLAPGPQDFLLTSTYVYILGNLRNKFVFPTTSFYSESSKIYLWRIPIIK